MNNVTTLIYVSCGFDALARDTDRLLSLGGGRWKLIGTVTRYVLFPGSDHAKNVAIFNRSAKSERRRKGGNVVQL